MGMRLGRWLALVPLALLLGAAPACSTGQCFSYPAAPCPAPVVIESRAADAPTSTFVVGGVSRSFVHAVAPSESPLEGSCYANVVGGGGEGSAGKSVDLEARVSAQCLIGGVTISFDIALGDVRRQAPGKRRLELSGWTSRSPRSPSSTDCRILVGYGFLEGATRVELEITEATGGSAPLPALVTSDYQREITVRIESTACVPIDATLRFTSRAADFTFSPRPCEICAL